MPAVPQRRRAALPLAALLPALAGLVPAPAQANDRDLRGTPVPAAACVAYLRTPAGAAESWSPGSFGVVGPGQSVRLRCPLPVNNVDLSGTSNDNDLTKLRAHYRDTDGFGTGGVVFIELLRTTASAQPNTSVCIWSSNVDGTGGTTATTATKTCPHDLAAGAFYHLDVLLLATGAGNVAEFFGVDFPQ